MKWVVMTITMLATSLLPLNKGMVEPERASNTTNKVSVVMRGTEASSASSMTASFSY